MAKTRVKIILPARVECLLPLARKDQRAAKGQRVPRKRKDKSDF